MSATVPRVLPSTWIVAPISGSPVFLSITLPRMVSAIAGIAGVRRERVRRNALPKSTFLLFILFVSEFDAKMRIWYYREGTMILQ